MSTLLNPIVSVIGGVIWIILMNVFGVVGMRGGSRLYRETATDWVSRTPAGGSIFMAMLGLLCTFWAPLFYLSVTVNPGMRHQPMSAGGWLAFALLVSMNVAMGVFCFLISGPNELRLNLDQRTYRHCYGWRHKPQVQTGPMDDIGGLYLQPYPNTGSYFVRIAWKTECGSSPVLGAFTRSFPAERFIDETAEALGLPLVEPPPLGKAVSTKVIHPKRWY